MADKGVLRTFEKLDRRADLNDLAVLHHHNLIGEGQSLGLVVRDVDHRSLHALVQFLQLRAQLPFEVRVDHRQRLVEHDDIDVVAHEATAHGDLLLVVRRQVRGTDVEHAFDLKHRGDLGDALGDLGFSHAAIAQGKGKVLAHRHRVVDDRELKYLCDVALIGRQIGDVAVIEENAALGRVQEARDDVQ